MKHTSPNHEVAHATRLPSRKLSLGTASAKAGQKSWGQLHVSEGRKKVSLPVCAIHGAKPGPHLVVVANQHGQEVNGIESVRRFCEEVDPKRLKGTVFALPSMNPYATLAMKQVWDEDDPPQTLKPEEDHYKNQYNMNWSWKRKRDGLLVQAITYEVWHRAISSTERKASAVIDIHCHQGKSAIYVSNPHDPRELGMALASGLEVLSFKGGDGDIATLYGSCAREGIAHTTVELHQQQVFNRNSIAEGVRLIRNVLQFQGMLPGKPKLPARVLIVDPWSTVNPALEGEGRTYRMVTSRHAGIVVPHATPLTRVRKGDLINQVIDPHTCKVLQTVRAPVTSLLHQAHEFHVPVKPGGRLALFPLKPRVVNPAHELRRLNGR